MKSICKRIELTTFVSTFIMTFNIYLFLIFIGSIVIIPIFTIFSDFLDTKTNLSYVMFLNNLSAIFLAAVMGASALYLPPVIPILDFTIVKIFLSLQVSNRMTVKYFIL